MAPTKLNVKLIEALFDELDKDTKIKKGEIESPKQAELLDLFLERRAQRSSLFKFTKIWTSVLLGFLIILITLQSIIKFKVDPNFVFLDKVTFNILSVAIIGQFLGIMIIITRSLWNDKNYVDLFKDVKENEL